MTLQPWWFFRGKNLFPSGNEYDKWQRNSIFLIGDNRWIHLQQGCLLPLSCWFAGVCSCLWREPVFKLPNCHWSFAVFRPREGPTWKNNKMFPYWALNDHHDPLMLGLLSCRGGIGGVDPLDSQLANPCGWFWVEFPAVTKHLRYLKWSNPHMYKLYEYSLCKGNPIPTIAVNKVQYLHFRYLNFLVQKTQP